MEMQRVNDTNPRTDGDCCGPGWRWVEGEPSANAKLGTYQFFGPVCKAGYLASMGPKCGENEDQGHEYYRTCCVPGSKAPPVTRTCR